MKWLYTKYNLKKKHLFILYVTFFSVSFILNNNNIIVYFALGNHRE